MSAITFPIRPASGRRPKCPDESFTRTGYGKTSTNPKGLHWGVDIDKEDFTPPPISLSNWIIQLPEKAKLIDKGYDDEGAGFWMEWLVLVGPWKGRYMRFFHMYRACGFSVGTIKARSYAVGRVGSTGRSTGAHLHFELGAKRWDVSRDPRRNPRQACCDAAAGRDF